MLLEVVAVDDLQPALVDDLALLIHHLVVLERVLAHFGVAGLDRVLRPLNRLGHRLRLDRHVIGQCPAHHPAHGAGGEQTQQLVVEAQVEAALARVALAARAAAELVVDPPALVALAAQHVEPAQLAHLFALGPAAGLHGGLAALQLGHTLFAVDVDALGRQLVLGQQLGIAPEDDVDATAGHVGRDRDRTAPAGLGHDLGLSEVLLGVQHVVRSRPASPAGAPAARTWPPRRCRSAWADRSSWRSTMSSTTALNLASSDLNTRSGSSRRSISLLVGMGTTGSP